jgi:HTH-type transcriptional regulator, competence development regulator
VTEVPEELRRLLSERRRKLGLSLRDVEEKTGIKNAHLSQIETGAIERPAPNLLYELAVAYQLDFKTLMRHAGHTKRTSANRGAMLNAAFRALDELSPAQQAAAVEYLESLRDGSAQGK